MRYRERMKRVWKLGQAPFHFQPRDWFGFFSEHGWQAKETRYLSDEAERLGRPAPLPLVLKIAFKIRGLFASEERKRAWRRFAGYSLLERK
jgi:hypothetical protein